MRRSDERINLGPHAAIARQQLVDERLNLLTHLWVGDQWD
jgi:hypothetical protein